jgi:hypothetical protein
MEATFLEVFEAKSQHKNNSYSSVNSSKRKHNVGQKSSGLEIWSSMLHGDYFIKVL